MVPLLLSQPLFPKAETGLRRYQEYLVMLRYPCQALECLARKEAGSRTCIGQEWVLCFDLFQQLQCRAETLIASMIQFPLDANASIRASCLGVAVIGHSIVIGQSQEQRNAFGLLEQGLNLLLRACYCIKVLFVHLRRASARHSAVRGHRTRNYREFHFSGGMPGHINLIVDRADLYPLLKLYASLMPHLPLSLICSGCASYTCCRLLGLNVNSCLLAHAAVNLYNTLGLGCMATPVITRMTQTGIEHTFKAEVASVRQGVIWESVTTFVSLLSMPSVTELCPVSTLQCMHVTSGRKSASLALPCSCNLLC